MTEKTTRARSAATKARSKAPPKAKPVKAKPKATTNPLLARWSGKFQEPPFARIEAKHFRPALLAAFREHKAEIEKIAANPAKPTFANTILALEKSGTLLARVGAVFSNLEATDSTPRAAGYRARYVAPLCSP